MLVNCLNLQYSAICASYVTNRHTLLAPASQMARQIELYENSICCAASILIHLTNQFESIIPSSAAYTQPVGLTSWTRCPVGVLCAQSFLSICFFNF